MRVLSLIHSLRRGGAERIALEVTLGLGKRGHDVALVSLLDVDEYADPRYSPVAREFILDRSRYQWPWAIRQAAPRLRRIAHLFKPDVLTIHTPTLAWVAAASGSSAPCVHVLHGHSSIKKPSTLKGLTFHAGDLLAQFHIRATLAVVSPSMVQPTRRYFGRLAHQITCLSNGIDMEAFSYTPTRPRARPTFLMVGTLSPNKGQHFGLRALKDVLQVLPTARLLIAGEGSDRQSLRDAIKSLGLGSNVELLGRRSDVHELMTKVDLCWHLSESEGLPMAVLEAMASGLPVIGFDAPGTRDLVQDWITGTLVAHGDVRGLAERTLQLLADDKSRQLLSSQARSFVERHYSLNAMLDQHEAAYCKALNSARE